MTELQGRLVHYIQKLPEDRLAEVFCYMLDIFGETEGATPLDDFDYELLRRANEARAKGDMEFTPFEEVMAEIGLTIDDLEKMGGETETHTGYC